MRYQLKALSLLILLITILKASNGNFNDSRKNNVHPIWTQNGKSGRQRDLLRGHEAKMFLVH